MERASENGSRGETPCAGAGAALAPAQVRAAARRSIKDQSKGKRKNASFRAGCTASRDGNGRFAQPHGTAPAHTGRNDLIRPRCARPPSPEGKALRTDVPDWLQSRARGNDFIRPRCARPPSPKGKALRTDVPDWLQSRARGNDLIRPRCARPPSPEGKAAAALSCCTTVPRPMISIPFRRGFDIHQHATTIMLA